MFNLSYYDQQGHNWNLSQELYLAVNSWLEYKEIAGFPIRNAQTVEMILKRLNDCCTRDDQKVTLIENAIAGNFASIRYQTPIESNGNQVSDKRSSLEKLRTQSRDNLIRGADNL